MLPIQVNLKDKVVVITGAGGVICSYLARIYAESGAKVALLDLNKEMAEKNAKVLREEGYVAYGYEANVLKKDSLSACHEQILKDLGPCDILVNGAGGNNPRATTDNEFAELDDAKKGIKSFFELDESGVEFVFNLNFLGTLLPTQIFAEDRIGRKDCSILNISSRNASLHSRRFLLILAQKLLFLTSQSGLLFTSLMLESVSMPLLLDSSLRSRTKSFYGIRMALRPLVLARS